MHENPADAAPATPIAWCSAVGYFNTAHLALSEPRPGLNLELRADYRTDPEPTDAPVES